MDTAQDDSDAVRRVLDGDGRAFAALVERHQLRVYRFILRQVPVADAAEDLAQETFLQAYRALATYNAQSRFSTWLLGIARNVVLNFVNREWQPNEVARLGDTEAGRAQDPVDAWQRDQALRQLLQAVDQLGADLRDTLALVAFEDLDYAEASALLGVPVGTVKSRVSRARARLRAALGEDFFASLLCGDGTF